MCTENIPWRSILNKQVRNCTLFAVPTISARVLVFTANDSARLARPWVKMLEKKKTHFSLYPSFFFIPIFPRPLSFGSLCVSDLSRLFS